ncbi:MAG: AAA family ATPase [Elusimicrobiales bacterium]|nr:AAA family ATPase [Elusimicrobiales bacterium]
MIKRLRLTDFGKFKERELKFGPCTVITGPNEAGKTTVFDALFDALCAGCRHEGRPAWKNLAGRYGALRRAELEWEEGFSPAAFDDAEFLELFAIRAGETSVNAANGKTWETVAEARLLNAGLNPAQLAASLIDKADSSRKGSLKARIKELNKLIELRGPELAAYKARRDAIFSGEAETARLEAELKARNAVLDEKRAQQRALANTQEELAMACRLASAEAGIKALRALKETSSELAALAKFEKNEAPAYRALNQEYQDRQRDAASAGAALGEKQAVLAAAKASLDRLVARMPVLKKQVETAAALSSRLTVFFSAPPKVTLTVSLPARFGIWAAALALAGFVAYSGGGAGAYAAAAAIVAAGAWAGLKLSVKETLSPHTPDEIKVFLDGLAAEWTTISEEKLPSGLEEARAYLAKAGADAAAAADSLKSRSAEFSDLEVGVKLAARSLEEQHASAAEAKAKAAEWLKERGCASEDEYQGRVTAYEKLSAKLSDIEQRVALFRQKTGAASQEELKDRLFMDKEALDQKGVNPSKTDEAELERLKARASVMGKEVHSLEAEAAELKAALKTVQAVAGAKLEGLPEHINRAENDLAAARDEISGLELQAQGYMLAAEAFNKLAEKSTVAFDALAKEVSSALDGALPGPEARFGSFDAAEASLKDAGGRLRPVKFLSSGTRDLFMLAARLMMAKKARTAPDGQVAPALLVLDEPFYTLDPAREGAALGLLAAFQKTTGWQIIILTKDAAVAPKAAEAGLPVKVVEL